MRRQVRQSQRGVDKRLDDRIEGLEKGIDLLQLMVSSLVRLLVSHEILALSGLEKLVSDIEDEDGEPADGSS